MEIELVSYQSGPKGFVQYGIDPPIDYLFLRVNGGRGGGKTYGGALRAFLYMHTYPRSRGMIVGLTTDKVRDSILPTMFEIFNKMGLKYGTHYEYNKTERLLHLKYSDSFAFVRSAEEPQNLPGPTLSWFWLDESRKMPEEVFLLLVPTLRQEGFPRQCWTTSTPAGKAHWSRKIWLPRAYARENGTPAFELPKTADGRTATFVSYRAKSMDNPHHDPVLLATLKGMYEEGSQLYKQEVLGEEVLQENMVFPSFDREFHVVPRERWPVKDFEWVIAGVDFGHRAPSAILVVGIDRQGRRYLLDEFYQTRLSEKELCEQAALMRDKYHIKAFFCDSADPRWINAMRDAPYYLDAVGARKSVGDASEPTSGIGLCYRAWTQRMPDGTPYKYVEPKCRNFVREIENYVYDEGTELKNLPERPRKKADHLMACDRYVEIAIATWGIDRGGLLPQVGKVELVA